MQLETERLILRPWEDRDAEELYSYQAYMQEKVCIRNERESDYQTVEQITREAFYNMYVPGCFEHYLVHIMRAHEDFIPELDFVIMWAADSKAAESIIYAAKMENIRRL